MAAQTSCLNLKRLISWVVAWIINKMESQDTPISQQPQKQGDMPSSGSPIDGASPYFKRRYDGKTTTRREVMEQRFKGKSPRHYVSPSSLSSTTEAPTVGPAIPDPGARDSLQSPPRLSQKPLPRRSSSSEPSDEAEFIQQREQNEQNAVTTDAGNDQEIPTSTTTASTQPQHLTEQRYYRVVYRGVVSLLSGQSRSSPRSGAYVSFGEIIASMAESFVVEEDEEDFMQQTDPSTPMRTETLSKVSASKTIAKTTGPKVIRVDQVLTGGYMIDATDNASTGSAVVASDQTPKRGNTHPYGALVGPSPLPLFEEYVNGQGEDSGNKTSNPHGYLLECRSDHIPILVPIAKPPLCEYGNFLYKVISSTPLAVYMGPSKDAPTTKGMLVPGTTHEVCLRVVDDSLGVCYLRLMRRRGWVVDRRIVSKNVQDSLSDPFIVMKDVTDKDSECSTDCNSSIVSVAASSVATPLPAATKRHRPPRRRRQMNKDTIEGGSVPRHVPGPEQSSTLPPQSRTNSHDYDAATQPQPHHLSHGQDRGVMSPSSNVSLLSDESSLEHSMIQQNLHRHIGMTTPDRSTARSTASSSGTLGASNHPSFFIMRVNAPRGLKILDAPHFQVNNLIHGSHPALVLSSPSKESYVGGGAKGSSGTASANQSIFQTMSGGHHTTTLTSKIGNPAIFDSITKARKLPRGSVFEASKRMESSGAFSLGSGLIKLSDNSGWAIVPKREDLDEQYRNVSGALAGIKEGEASRAFEEVGNAMIDDSRSPIYLRILTRTGVVVSLPPSTTISDDETSPTSSAGGSSSVISGNGGSGHIRCQDSDVASSVGSSFLDAMFRTPKRKDRDSDENSRRDVVVANPNPPKAPVTEKPPFSTLLPCGSFVEVERWAPPPESERHATKTDYVRLRGGQGWIPRSLNGKPVAEIISPPETRFGSFWFRVQDRNGIKVRWGPSSRAPSIKSDDGVYFRFECGEFLRASEVVTFFRQNTPAECYAKLYRNRHVRLYAGHGEIRPLVSLTVQAEWVQVFGYQELFLEECAVEPRIERHKQGWRYNVVLDARVQIRKGPSFEAETNGAVLLGGESVLINERVTGPDDTTTWLRLKDGQGWVHNVDTDGEVLMIPHSLRHRNGPLGRPAKAGRPQQEDIAYNTIVARLFRNDIHEQNDPGRHQSAKPKRRWN